MFVIVSTGSLWVRLSTFNPNQNNRCTNSFADNETLQLYTCSQNEDTKKRVLSVFPDKRPLITGIVWFFFRTSCPFADSRTYRELKIRLIGLHQATLIVKY